jgi:probable F420-dependent oxidoreductase
MTIVSEATPAAALGARPSLGTIGVWAPRLGREDEAQAREHAKLVEALGYGALWLPGGVTPGALERAELLLGATDAIAVAAMLDVAVENGPAAAADAGRLRERHPGRFLLGIGNRPVVLDPDRSRHSLQALQVIESIRSALDSLDAADPPVPPEARLLAAIERPLLELARERAAGALTPLTTPEHTRRARAILGPDRLLAVEQAAVYEPDPEAARGYARSFLSTRLGANSYTETLRETLGVGDADLEGGGSDELVDQLVAWGDESKIRARVLEHFDAGAEHVCVHVIETASESAMDTLDRLVLSLGY